MARDPLAVLARLRQIETEAARRRLGQAVGRAEVALLAEASARGALVAEASAPGPDYGAWLPRGLAQRDRAALARRRAEAGLAEAAAALGEARAAERAVELLAATQARLARRQAARRAQAQLDEAAARRHGAAPSPSD